VGESNFVQPRSLGMSRRVTNVSGKISGLRNKYGHCHGGGSIPRPSHALCEIDNLAQCAITCKGRVARLIRHVVIVR
jgi:hypothetical protein